MKTLIKVKTVIKNSLPNYFKCKFWKYSILEFLVYKKMYKRVVDYQIGLMYYY